MATMAYPHHKWYALCAAKDGTLGFSDCKNYFPLYGRLLQVSEVTPVTSTSSRETDTSTRIRIGFEYIGVDHTARQRSKVEETSPLENVLFRYKKGKDGQEVVYVQEEWQKGYRVRRLFSNALRGRGAMLASNNNRVYVLDTSIPLENETVGRGYLQVDGSDKVEHFLQGIGWASRCEGIELKAPETDEMVKTFVIKDRTRCPTTGYDVVCTKSSRPKRLICHLEPIGRVRDMMRKVVPRKGESELGPWARRVHGAQSLLFD